MKNILFILLTLSTLTACTQNISPNTYDHSEVGVASRVVSGSIIAKRSVAIDNNSGVGGVAGAATGGVAGSLVGNTPAASIIGAVGGAVVGGVLGNAVDKAANQHAGVEYIIKLKDKSIVSIVQAQDLNFTVHQHVLIIYGATTRIIPDTVDHA